MNYTQKTFTNKKNYIKCIYNIQEYNTIYTFIQTNFQNHFMIQLKLQHHPQSTHITCRLNSPLNRHSSLFFLSFPHLANETEGIKALCAFKGDKGSKKRRTKARGARVATPADPFVCWNEFTRRLCHAADNPPIVDRMMSSRFDWLHCRSFLL